MCKAPRFGVPYIIISGEPEVNPYEPEKLEQAREAVKPLIQAIENRSKGLAQKIGRPTARGLKRLKIVNRELTKEE